MSVTVPRIIALVPMRHESERVPGKNYRPLGGKPLYQHIVAQLLACTSVAEVVIDTDSPIIATDAGHTFPAVRLLERPDHLRDGRVPMTDVLLHDVAQVEADLYLQTHSTNPLLRAETIERAIASFVAKRTVHDSLFSATRLQARLWDGAGEPLNHDPGELLRTQDLAPLYLENSCIYLFDATTLRRRLSRIGERPLIFEIGGEEAHDIDEEDDFRLAEVLLASRAREPCIATRKKVNKARRTGLRWRGARKEDPDGV